MIIAIITSMKTVQMTLEPSLVDAVDRAARSLGTQLAASYHGANTTRSAFTRDALRDALIRLEERDLERRHRIGYEKHPVEPGEFSDWEDEQAWGD